MSREKIYNIILLVTTYAVIKLPYSPSYPYVMGLFRGEHPSKRGGYLDWTKDIQNPQIKQCIVLFVDDAGYGTDNIIVLAILHLFHYPADCPTGL